MIISSRPNIFTEVRKLPNKILGTNATLKCFYKNKVSRASGLHFKRKYFSPFVRHDITHITCVHAFNCDTADTVSPSPCLLSLSPPFDGSYHHFILKRGQKILLHIISLAIVWLFTYATLLSLLSFSLRFVFYYLFFGHFYILNMFRVHEMKTIFWLKFILCVCALPVTHTHAIASVRTMQRRQESTDNSHLQRDWRGSHLWCFNSFRLQMKYFSAVFMRQAMLMHMLFHRCFARIYFHFRSM